MYRGDVNSLELWALPKQCITKVNLYKDHSEQVEAPMILKARFCHCSRISVSFFLHWLTSNVVCFFCWKAKVGNILCKTFLPWIMKTQIKRTIVAQFYSPLSVRPLSVYCYLVRVFCFTSSSTTLFILHVISECWCGGHLLGGWSYVVVESGDNSSPQWKKHSPWVRVSLFCSMNSGMGSTQHKSGQEFLDKTTEC